MPSQPIAWKQRIIEGALLGFAFFSPWSIAGAQTCLGLGLVVWIVSLIASRGRRFTFSPLGWPIAVFLGIQLLSALVSPDPWMGLKALRAEWIVLLFFLVVNVIGNEESARRMVDVLVLSTALVSLYAIWQHYFGWDLYRNRPLRPTGNVFEATGLFGHHLTFGGYVMVVLVVSSCLFWFGTQGKRKILYGIASILFTLALVFSYARSAWLGLLGGILAMGLLRGRKIFLLGLASLLILILIVYMGLPSVRLQVQEIVDILRDPMIKSSRLQMWLAALRLIGDHPLLGVGLGQVKMSLAAYGCHLGYAHVHNDMLNQAANAGLLGWGAFLWMWVAFLRLAAGCRGPKNRSRWSRALATAGFGLMVAFLVAGQFQCYYTDAEDGMLLWFLLGSVVAVCGATSDRKGDSPNFMNGKANQPDDQELKSHEDVCFPQKGQ